MMHFNQFSQEAPRPGPPWKKSDPIYIDNLGEAEFIKDKGNGLGTVKYGDFVEFDIPMRNIRSRPVKRPPLRKASRPRRRIIH